MNNYKTIKVDLKKSTKSLHIILSKTNKNNSICIDMIFELNSILAWSASHLEINNIVISSEDKQFCSGYDYKEMQDMNNKDLHNYLIELQKIIHGIMYLPQTVIVDLNYGASNLGIELATVCDLRICHSKCNLNFDFLNRGMVPACGGISILSAMIGHSLARNWIMSSEKVSSKKLIDSGFIYKVYNKSPKDIIKKILIKINAQSQVSRIQCKRSFLEFLLPELERSSKYETSFSLASMTSNDWKKAIKKEPFTIAKELAIQISNKINKGLN